MKRERFMAWLLMTKIRQAASTRSFTGTSTGSIGETGMPRAPLAREKTQILAEVTGNDLYADRRRADQVGRYGQARQPRGRPASQRQVRVPPARSRRHLPGRARRGTAIHRKPAATAPDVRQGTAATAAARKPISPEMIAALAYPSRACAWTIPASLTFPDRVAKLPGSP